MGNGARPPGPIRVRSLADLSDRALRCWVFGHRWPLDPVVVAFNYWGFAAGLIKLRCSGCGSVRRDVVPPVDTAEYEAGEVWTRAYQHADHYLLAFPATRRDLRREWYDRHPISEAA